MNVIIPQLWLKGWMEFAFTFCYHKMLFIVMRILSDHVIFSSVVILYV